MDDVINVTGHRLGTAEVEDVLVRIYLGLNTKITLDGILRENYNHAQN